jgi:hypothetical protein
MTPAPSGIEAQATPLAKASVAATPATTSDGFLVGLKVFLHS